METQQLQFAGGRGGNCPVFWASDAITGEPFGTQTLSFPLLLPEQPQSSRLHDWGLGLLVCVASQEIEVVSILSEGAGETTYSRFQPVSSY